MTITILTLFPSMFESVFSVATVKRAIEKKLLEINLVNIRDFSQDKHKTVDDKPYGGGAGMIIKIDVLVRALESVVGQDRSKKVKVVFLSPQGKQFNDKRAKHFSKIDHLILICGRYEGVDSRIKHFIDEEISIGDYVLSGGEIAAMVLVETITRKIKGVLSKEESIENETFSKKILKYPQFTRPAEFRGIKVPNILLSGDHQKIIEYRKSKAEKETIKKRPDLIKI